MSDPKVKAAYNALESAYADLRTVLDARTEAGRTQAQIAERMGTTASAIARFEASLITDKHSPTVNTLIKYTTACQKKLRILLT